MPRPTRCRLSRRAALAMLGAGAGAALARPADAGRGASTPSASRMAILDRTVTGVDIGSR